MADAPRRRVAIELTLGADDWKTVASELRHIAFEIDRGRMRERCISGGYSSGFVLTASEDESVTHDSYHEANDAYVASLPEARTEGER